jgi:uncharacterized protein YebE (UPF0316 family)
VLRNRGYGVTHTLEVGRTGKSDEEQLADAVKRKMKLPSTTTKNSLKIA